MEIRGSLILTLLSVDLIEGRNGFNWVPVFPSSWIREIGIRFRLASYLSLDSLISKCRTEVKRPCSPLLNRPKNERKYYGVRKARKHCKSSISDFLISLGHTGNRLRSFQVEGNGFT